MSEARWNARVIAADSRAAIAQEMRAGGCPPRAVRAMAPRGQGVAVALEGLDSRLAAVLKQEMLAAGGDAALHPDAWLGRAPDTAVVLVGTRRQFDALLAGLAETPLDLPEVGREIADALEGHARRQFDLDLPAGRLQVGPRPLLMGVVNVTPDSFSDGGRFLEPRAAVDHARRLVDEGADILDIGGESTRPGSDPVPEDEEARRVLPVIEKLSGAVRAPLSIDTRRGGVARRAVAAGAAIINDVTGLQGDADVAAAAAETGAAVVIMHMQGTPKTMQESPRYGNLMADICRYLRAGMAVAARAGIRAERILVDPGIGFGKTLEHNLEILARLGELRSLGRPVLVGPSRKRFLGDLTGVETPAARTFGTAAACALAVAAGALVLRVHDVGEMRQAAAVAHAVCRAAWDAP